MTPPHLAIRSRGATCPRRGIPLVDAIKAVVCNDPESVVQV